MCITALMHAMRHSDSKPTVKAVPVFRTKWKQYIEDPMTAAAITNEDPVDGYCMSMEFVGWFTDLETDEKNPNPNLANPEHTHVLALL